jgi:hypothetical protein
VQQLDEVAAARRLILIRYEPFNSRSKFDAVLV